MFGNKDPNVHFTKPLPLSDLAYGKFIYYGGHAMSSLPNHIVVRVKGRKELGWTIIPDLPKDALRYIAPGKHPWVPPTGVYILLTGPSGESVIGEELGLLKGELFEKIADATTKAEYAGAAKMIAEKEALKSKEEIMSEATKGLKEVREATSTPFPFAEGGNRPFRRSP